MADSAREKATSMTHEGLAAPSSKVPRTMLAFVATCGFVGYTPLAPGTAGSAAGLLVVRFGFGSLCSRPPAGLVILLVVLFIASCAVTDRAERLFGEVDCSAIVLDEMFGMIATMLGNPIGWSWLIVGFTLFRLFDIIKPWPASWFDRMQGGAGIMLDDLAAAFYASAILQVLRHLI
jgi:phosphatidylglycerophosphatase A